MQFAPKLEAGPTATKAEGATPTKSNLASQAKKEDKTKSSKKMALANGVVVEEFAAGTGQKAKNGSKLGIRYIGKLKNGGKEFDKNVKGKPFRFTLGKGEVIKGTFFTF